MTPDLDINDQIGQGRIIILTTIGQASGGSNGRSFPGATNFEGVSGQGWSSGATCARDMSFAET